MSEEEHKEETIRVMLVDDHTSFRQPLAIMLEREPDLKVVAQAGSLAETRKLLEEEAELGVVDVAMVDLELPDGSGVDFISELHEIRPKALALVLSAYSDRVLLARAIEAGASGVMHKSSPLEDIVEAVRRLFRGEQLLSQQEVIEVVWLLNHKRREEREGENTLGRLTP